MSTLVEIEEAIVRLPEKEIDRLVEWLENRRTSKALLMKSVREPDFLERARRIWGDRPEGEALSRLVARSRD